jgi:polysaccharide deacetylase 2 family uncharacterized protein YibQ
MATPPKKKRTTSTPKKKTGGTPSVKRTSRKTSSKRKSHKKRTAGKGKQTFFILLIIAAMSGLVAVGYCLGTCWQKEKKKAVKVPKKSLQHSLPTKQKQPPSMPKAKHVLPKPKVIEKPAEKTEKPVNAPSITEHTGKYISKLAYRGERPRLVIIIDDVHTLRQLHAIQALPFPVNPSIFPPYTLAPNTAKLATQAVHYMIHLPMESGNAKFDRQSKTLKTGFNREQMRKRIHELRMLFPRAHYINNHTGSKFTGDARAMEMLYGVMKEEGFTFIDSRTTGGSKVGKIAHAYGDDYVARDIFLDNVKSVAAIHTQLKKAVRLAKKNGYAIAIGHPHKITMQALRTAKPLLKEVEVVYIDEIFREE